METTTLVQRLHGNSTGKYTQESTEWPAKNTFHRFKLLCKA